MSTAGKEKKTIKDGKSRKNEIAATATVSSVSIRLLIGLIFLYGKQEISLVTMLSQVGLKTY